MNLKIVTAAMCLLSFATAAGFSQSLKFERERHKAMLELIKGDIKKNYYDPQLRGIDLEARIKAANEKMEKAASIGQLTGIIAQVLIEFDDSHLFFLPPGKANKTDYGFDFRMAGDRCFVYQVDKGGDAEKKGLQIGDELYAIQGFAPTRENLWKIRYTFYRLRPHAGLVVDAIKPDGKQVQYAIEAKISKGKKIMDLTGPDINQFIRESEDAVSQQRKQWIHDRLEGVFIWKMPGFSLDPNKVDEIIGRARKFPAMVIDLRDNSGGRVDMLLRLVSNIFDKDVKAFDEKRRKETKEVIAKSRGKEAYSGKLVVLIDSESGSAAEVFSKIIQLEGRGTVVGDVSAGAVMESRYYGHQLGLDTVVFFGSSVTIADLIMKDGKSLEKVGVVPDVKIIPTGKELASRQDVVMSKALESLGISITPEIAGKLFPEEENTDN